MKPFLLKILLIICLPLSVVIGYVEYALRGIPNNYQYKNMQIERYIDSIRILTLGASHGYYGINPAYFTDKGFNLSFISQSYKYDHWLYNKYIDRCKELQYLILPVSYPMLRTNLETGLEWWRIKGYCIYMGCDYHIFEPKYHLEISTKDQLKLFKEILFKEVNNITCDSLGYGTNYKMNFRSEEWWSTGMTACIRHTNSSMKYINENVQYIQNIIADCNKRGIKVILLTTPTHNSYYDLLEVSQLTEMERICDNLDKQCEHVVYLNWLKHSDFTEEDFFDADHLNEIGAEKLTRMLDDYIMNWE